MVAALFVTAAVLLAVPPPPHVRCRKVFGPRKARKTVRLSPSVIAIGITVLGGITVFGVPTGLLAAMVAAPLAARVVGRESAGTRRRRLEVERQLPAAIDLMTAVLDAGRPPIDAFTLVARATPAPLGPELALIAGRLSVAGDEQSVWEGLRGRPEFASLGRAFRRAGRSGMPVGRILAGLADELRRERRAASQERARSVSVATAAPLGACFLPAFFLIGILPTIVSAFRSLPI